MRLIALGAGLLAIGAVLSPSSISFGFTSAGIFLIIYGLLVKSKIKGVSPTTPTMLQVSTCPRCGTHLEPNAVYCPNCGEKVRTTNLEAKRS